VRHNHRKGECSLSISVPYGVRVMRMVTGGTGFFPGMQTIPAVHPSQLDRCHIVAEMRWFRSNGPPSRPWSVPERPDGTCRNDLPFPSSRYCIPGLWHTACRQASGTGAPCVRHLCDLLEPSRCSRTRPGVPGMCEVDTVEIGIQLDRGMDLERSREAVQRRERDRCMYGLALEVPMVPGTGCSCCRAIFATSFQNDCRPRPRAGCDRSPGPGVSS